MKNKEDSVYIKHILESINNIEMWTKDASFEDFSEDSDLLQSAVIRQLEIIGEATGKVSEELKDKYNEIPWKKVMGMRNRLIHEYMSIDLSLTWGVVQTEIPELKIQLEKLLKAF